MLWNNIELPEKNIYFKDDDSIIYCADNREILPLIPDKSIDLVLTDPDYNANNIGPNEREYDAGMPAMSVVDYKAWCIHWFNLVDAVSDSIVFTPGIANVWNYPPAYWVLCWHKPAAVSFNRLGGFNAWEPILVYGKPFTRLPQDYLLFNTLNSIKGVEKNHPCPKPVSLWSYLISISKANLILDPFLGSGTTAVAAKKLGRKCIGVEIEERYCKIAVDRLRQSVMRLDER